MRRAAAVAVAAAAVALFAAEGRAADECDGLMNCIPVAGPWVVVPAPGAAARYPSAAWELRCPEGVVAGLDARLTDRAIDISFGGLLGSPVNPGITTTDAVVFTGTYTGRRRAATSFRPFIGCLPGGGGRRTPTAAGATEVFRPGKPLVRRVKLLRLRPGSLARTTHGCRRGERLVSASHAAGFFMSRPPSASQLAFVRVTRAVRGGRILVSASRQGVRAQTRVAVQIHAVCARADRR